MNEPNDWPMFSRPLRAILVAACLLVPPSAVAQTSAPAAAPSTRPAAPADAKLAAALAERLGLAASQAADAGDDASLRAAAALLDLARLYAPDEPRFARASSDVLIRLGERERAIAALGAVRALAPDDPLAMIRYVDLSLAGLETADARAAYAQRVANATGVAAEVRAHAAVQLAEVYAQRSQDAQAAGAIDLAYSLDPMNVAALEARYRNATRGGDAKPADRVRVLGQLIEASPADPRNLVTLAQECAAAGDYDGAAQSYRLGFALAAAVRRTPALDDAVDYAAAELLAGRPDAAQAMADGATAAVPTDGRFYSIALLRAMVAGAAPESLAEPIAAARGVYVAQLAGLSTLLNEPTATTMPATRPAPPVPNVAADVAKLAAGDPQNLSTAYAVALSELVWFDLFFRAAPVDDATLDAVRQLVGEAEPIVVRFEGWRLLDAGKLDEAKLKFEAVADRDGFAQLGLIATAVAAKDDARARELTYAIFATRPTGMYAAHVALAAQRQGIKTPTDGVDAAVAGVATQTRQLVGALLDQPRERYLITADPLNVSAGLGEPVLARLTLLNVGDRPITIGPRGYVNGEFSIDAQVRGDAPKGFPAAVVGEWAGAVKLAPKRSISQVVRVDGGALASFLKTYPSALVPMSAFVTTNVLTGPRGSTPGPGGLQTQVGGVFERRSAPLYVEAYRSRLLASLKSGTPAERVGAAELIGAVLPDLRKQADNAEAQTVAATLADALNAQAAADPDAAARAWINAFAAAGRGATPTVAGADDAVATLTLAWQGDVDATSAARAAGAIGDGTIAELAAATLEHAQAAPTTAPAKP